MLESCRIANSFMALSFNWLSEEASGALPRNYDINHDCTVTPLEIIFLIYSTRERENNYCIIEIYFFIRCNENDPSVISLHFVITSNLL